MTTDIVNEPTTVQQPEGAETTEEPEIVIPKGMKIKKMPKPDKTGHEMQVILEFRHFKALAPMALKTREHPPRVTSSAIIWSFPRN